MPEQILFATRQNFREWLVKNCTSDEGIWIVFGKKGGPKTLTLQEAQEEAVCFGWVDSLMHSVDDKTYILYFRQRRKRSKWSQTNKALAAMAEEKGLMTDCGREKIAEAKKNGQWDAPPPEEITDEQIGALTAALQGHEPAYTNFLTMPLSAKSNYTGFYVSAKLEKTRITRLAKIIDRLNKNLKLM